MLPQDVLDERKKTASAVVMEAPWPSPRMPAASQRTRQGVGIPGPRRRGLQHARRANESEAIAQRSVDAANPRSAGTIAMLQQQAKDPGLNVGDALNLPSSRRWSATRTTIHAEDLQAGSSYDRARPNKLLEN